MAIDARPSGGLRRSSSVVPSTTVEFCLQNEKPPVVLQSQDRARWSGLDGEDDGLNVDGAAFLNGNIVIAGL